MNFSTQLVEFRKQAGISLKKLSDMSGVPVTTIFNYEHGVTPTLDKADKILKALGVSFAIGEVKAEKNEPLTLEELRKMDGEPAWFVSLKDNFCCWGIVRVVTMSQTWFIAVAGTERAFGDRDSYGESWLAYCHKQGQKKNNTLTLEEVYALDCEPVWIQDLENPRNSQWRICYFDDMKHFYSIGAFTSKGCLLKDYGETWVAYRRKPEEEK